MRNVFRPERFDSLIEGFLDLLYGIIVVRPVEIEIFRFHRVKNENFYVVVALRKHITEPAEIIVEIFKFIEPSHVFGIGQRIISLPLPPYRIGSEVLTHEVYAVYILKLGDTLQFLRRYVPTATGESFG